MASPNAIFNELASTTLKNRRKKFTDNVSKNNALYARLYEKGNVKEMTSGGISLVEELEYAENSTFQYYSGYEVLDLSPSDSLTAAEFPWKQAVVHVTASGLEIRSNKGPDKMIDLVKSRCDVAMKTMANQINIGLYSDGTAFNGKQIGGLQLLVSDAGTGTVGGINSSTFTFWQNKVQSAAAPIGGGGAVTPSKTTIKGLMNGLYYALTRGGDQPDLIIADTNYYQMFEDSLGDLQRFTGTTDVAKYGFQSLKFKNADVIMDNTAIPANHMYFLNTDYIRLRVHKDANMKQSEEKVSLNQDAVVIPIWFQGNLTTSNRALQGVLKA